MMKNKLSHKININQEKELGRRLIEIVNSIKLQTVNIGFDKIFYALFNDILLDKYNSILTKLILKKSKKIKKSYFLLATIYKKKIIIFFIKYKV